MPNEDRSAKSNDRSKGLTVIAVAAFVMLFVFIAMFSHSTSRRESEARRNKPSLGRPEQPAPAGQENRGSAVPLQSADMSGQDNNSDDVSPADLKKHGETEAPLRTGRNPRQCAADRPCARVLSTESTGDRATTTSTGRRSCDTAGAQ